jgi:hypothetical protein
MYGFGRDPELYVKQIYVKPNILSQYLYIMYKPRRKTRKIKKHKKTRKYKKTKHKKNKNIKKQKGGELNNFDLNTYLEQAHSFNNNVYAETDHCVFPCDTAWCGKDKPHCKKFKRIELNIPDNTSKALETCELSGDEDTSREEKNYFKDHETNLRYLREKYEKYFSLPANEWSGFIDNIENHQSIGKDGEKVILGPGELLIPFVNKGFLYLAHEHWRPSINFNYIIQILYKLRNFLMIIPTANTVMDKWFNLISGCSLHGSEDAFKRVTLSELLLLDALQKAGVINVQTIDIPIDNKIKKGNNDDYEIPFNYYKLYSQNNSTVANKKGTAECRENSIEKCYKPSTINSCQIAEDFNYNEATAETKGCDARPSFKFHILYISANEETFDAILSDKDKDSLQKWGTQ